ncbi:amidohydrolase family protein [Congregibacter sp.]|uniref:amidohydrolase family protein n=1 Tax=Congregibacter sp. TaxID=2744308 RepID=UPI003F6B93D0
MKPTILLLVTALLAPFAGAQDLLIRNASIHTMNADGELIDGDVLVLDGRIKRVGRDLKADDDVSVIDAQGRPVTPAFFAGISATGLADVGAVDDSVDSQLREIYTGLMHPEFDVRVAYNPHSAVVPVTRIEGFGYTLLSAEAGDRTLAGSGGLVRLDGGYDSFEGDRVVFVDLSGDAAAEVGGSRAAIWMLLRQAFAEIEQDDPEDLSLITPAGQETLAEVIEEGVFVVRVHRASDILQVLRFAEEEDIRLVIQGGREAWMVASELAAAEVPIVINALDNLPADFDSLGARLDNAALLHAAGVSVMFAEDRTPNARKVRQAAGNAVANGMPADAALAALTRVPAEVFGADARVIAPGARADLVIWSGDPLEVTTAADQVVLGGVVDSMVSRQTLLRDRYYAEPHPLGRAYMSTTPPSE